MIFSYYIYKYFIKCIYPKDLVLQCYTIEGWEVYLPVKEAGRRNFEWQDQNFGKSGAKDVGFAFLFVLKRF